MLQHKGYIGSVEFDDDVFHGRVLGIRAVVTFEGTSVKELKRAFKESVDDYLAFCKQRKALPEKPFSGRFITRVDPDLHRKLTQAAKASGRSLNTFIADVLTEIVQRQHI